MGHSIDRRYALTAVQLLSPLIALWALFTYATLPWLAVTLVMFFLMRTVGGVITYHRIHSHRTHTMHPVMEFIGTALGFYGSFTSPVEFCATHNNHHKFGDTEKDPHPHTMLGWKTLFPLLWNDSEPTSGDIRTVVRLRRNKITNLFYERFWIMISLPFLLLLVSPQAYFFIYFIPFTMSIWSAAYSTFNHDENGAKNMGFWYGIVSGGEHWHKWHHDHPYSTEGEGWLNTVANLIANKRHVK
jgi:fatty-acid desaturase